MLISALTKALNRFQKTKSRSNRKLAKKRTLRLEGLERREVFDATFDSLLTVGNDTTSILVRSTALDSAGNSYMAGFLYGEMDMDPAVDRPDRSDILVPRGSSDSYVVKYGPNNEFLWARRMGSDLRFVNLNDPVEGANKVTVDGNGNVYVTGIFCLTADFGSTQIASVGSADAYVTKLDANGNFRWTKSWGTTSREFGYDVSVDGSGNVVAVGATSYLYSNGAWMHTGAEIRKYSATGATAWSKSIAASGLNAGAVAVDSAGTVYVAGSFAGTIDMNPDPRKSNYISGSSVISGGGGKNAYVLKLSSSGVYSAAVPLVAKTAEQANSTVYIGDIAIDATGSPVFSGMVIGIGDLNPSSNVEYRISSTTNTGFVEKLNPNLTFAWATTVEGSNVNGLAVDATGIYTVSNFSTPITFAGTTYSPAGSLDVVVSKVSLTGTTEWVVTFGGIGEETGYGIATNALGAISVVGTFSGTSDFDPDPLVTNERTNTTRTDSYLLRLRRR